MPFMYIDDAAERKLARIAAMLGRSVEDIPALGVALLDWYAEQREQGFELLLGLRDDPDDSELVRIFPVKPFEVLVMDENGVSAPEPLADPPVPPAVPPVVAEPEPVPVELAIELDNWEEIVFLEASRICYGGEEAIDPHAIAFQLQSDRYHDKSGSYGEEIWHEDFRVELEREICVVLDRLTAAGCFDCSRDRYDNPTYRFTDAGWRFSNRRYSR